jgi:hypothetical protein
LHGRSWRGCIAPLFLRLKSGANSYEVSLNLRRREEEREEGKKRASTTPKGVEEPIVGPKID